MPSISSGLLGAGETGREGQSAVTAITLIGKSAGVNEEVFWLVSCDYTAKDVQAAPSMAVAAEKHR
jgi:hypothetical protein